jgi:hypothetical protein
LTIARAGYGSLGQRLPSMRTSAGAMPSAITARCMASMVACRMLRRSISSTLASATAQASARSRISGARRSRAASLSFLESARPSIGRAGIEDHRSRDHRPAQRPAPRLVDPADEAWRPAGGREQVGAHAALPALSR